MIGIREGQVTEMSCIKYPKEMREAVVARMHLVKKQWQILIVKQELTLTHCIEGEIQRSKHNSPSSFRKKGRTLSTLADKYVVSTYLYGLEIC